MTRVLVPVEVLEGQTVSAGVVDLLATADVVLLGYHVIPEQTTPEQARMSFEDRAQALLGDLADALTDAGATVETRLVFTRDVTQTVDRVAAETGSDVVVHLNPAMENDDVLVALSGDVDAARVGRVVADLVAGRAIRVHVLDIVAPGAGDAGLRDRAEAAMREGGVDPEYIDGRTVESDTPVAAIADAAVGVDAIVVPERTPGWREVVFGDFADRVAEAAVGPVLVVRSPEATDENPEA